ncbi:MAG: carboxylesterase family protein [bacterium]
MRRLVWLVVLGLWACDDGGSGDDPPEADGAVADAAGEDAAGGDAAGLDLGRPDLGGTDLGRPDLGAPDGGSACPAPPAGPDDVRLPAGLVRGRVEDGVGLFLGIPFAAPPVGDLRWRPPADPGCLPADGLDAFAYGPKCPQLDTDGSAIGEEDCLQLNVWRPVGAEGLPVMVFIHGGGNVQGSASQGAAGQILYDGARLARPFGVVVVTIQYRLGALGWLVHDSVAAADGRVGNYALLDEVAALRWVREHIAAFGGDPEKVMIFGESAGAVNVCTLVASPLAAGLFRASLMESGACLLPAPADVEAEGQRLVDAACPGAADVAGCLRSKTPAELLAAVPPSAGVISRGTVFQPYLDGAVLADQPERVIAAGRHNRVAFIAGANANETAQFVPPIPSAAAYEAAVRLQFGALAGQVLAAYPVDDFESPRDALIRVTSEARFICPTRRAGRAAASQGPAWMYHFTQALENAPRLRAQGAYHGLELFFVFQNTEFAGYRPTDGERRLAAAMGGYWTRFAADLDPGGDPVWPAWTPEGTAHLHLGADAIAADSALYQARCDFWDALIDAVP